MAEDLNTLIENVSNMVLATLYGLQVCIAFFLLCLVSGVFRCVWFAIPDAVFAQGYRPENRRPTAVGSTPFLLNALQFALYSLPNVLYFYSYALLICFWGSLLHVLFSQRPTTTGGGGGAAAQTASADSSRLIAYKPAARFFRFSVIGVALLQVGLFVSIFFVDFFTVVIANCMFVSALALFSIIAYAIHAVAVYRKLRPVYQHVLRARQWGSDSGGAVWPHSDMSMGLVYEQQAALLAASSSSAAASRAGGRSPLFETDEHSEWSIDARPRAKKGALTDRLADREDWRDYSGSGDAVGIPHRSSSSHSHSHNSSGGRYSPRNLSTTAPSMPPSLALLHAQHQTALHTPGASGGMMMLNHSMVSAGSSGGGGGMREISRSLTQTTPSQSGRGSAMAPVSTSADELSYAPGPEEGDDEDDEAEENNSRSHSGSDSRSRSRSRSRGSCSDASDTERGLASAPHEIDLSSSSSVSERSGVASPGLLLPPGTEDPYASPGPHVLPPMPAHAHMQSASPSPRYPPPQLLLLPAPVARTSKHSSFSPSPARSSASNSGGSSPGLGLGLGPGSGANGEHVVREEDFYAPPRSPSATPPRRKGSPFNAQQLQQQQYIAAPLSRAASPDYVAVTLTAEGLATRPPAAATGWGGIAGGVGVAGGTTRLAAPSLYTPRATSYATFSPAAVPVALAAAPSSDLDGSAEEALALYAYRQTRKILLLTVCVGLCSGARIASSLIELHYTWLQVHQDNDTSPDDQHANESAFPEQWFIFVDVYYLLFELVSSTVVMWLLMQSSGSANRTAAAAASAAAAAAAAAGPLSAVGPPAMSGNMFSPVAASGAASVPGSAGWGDSVVNKAPGPATAGTHLSPSSFGGMGAALGPAPPVSGSSAPHGKHAAHARHHHHHSHSHSHTLASSVPGGMAASLGHHSPGAHFASLHSRLLVDGGNSGSTVGAGAGVGAGGATAASSAAKGSPRSLLVHHAPVSAGGVPVSSEAHQASIAHRENLRQIFGHRKSKR